MENLNSSKVESILPNLDSLSQDFFNFISEIEGKSAKLESLLKSFNQFMTENKNNYYKNVKRILEDKKNNFKDLKQEQIL